MKFAKIPMATILRLSIYMRTLKEQLDNNVDIISSERLAKQCSVNPAQIRKDLAYFGEFGIRGVGYKVNDLVNHIRDILGLNRPWNLAMIGTGNLGSALVCHSNFVKNGYIFTAAFDVDPNKVGKNLPSGLVINHIDELESVVIEREVHVGIIATPPGEAQGVANMLVKSGINGIFNFAPVQVQVPDYCHLENVDFTIKLDSIAHHLSFGD